MSGIKNFAYTIPTIGRISIGEKIERNGKKLPKRLNHFLITTQHQLDGRFAEHPAMEAVAAATGQEMNAIRTIPIKLMFNDPDLNVRERYEAFDGKGRMLCSGDGEKARRMVAGKVETHDCPGADYCPFGNAARCSLMTRLNVQIDVPATEQYKPDPLSSFILRSAGFNTARTVRAKIKSLAAMLNGRLTGVPLDLQLRQKSSAGSYQSIFFYVDVVPRGNLFEAAQCAKAHAEAMTEAGLDQAAYEEAVKELMANGAFEDSSEDFLEAGEYIHTDATPAGTDNREGQGEEEGSGAGGEEACNPLSWMGTTRQQLGALEGMAPS